MYSALFLGQSLLQAALLWWLWRLWRRTGLLAAAVLLVPVLGLVWDNLIVGAGRFIGFGPLLEALSWPRFWLHWLFGTWLIVGAATALRLAGFEWMRRPQAMLVFCATVVGLMLYDLPHFWRDSLYPVCEFDLLRYSTAVAADATCFAGQPAVPGTPPFASIVTCLIVIGCGGALLVRHRWPWMFLGGVLMLLSASPLLREFKLDNFGEILIAGGCIAALARFSAGQRGPLHVPRPSGSG